MKKSVDIISILQRMDGKFSKQEERVATYVINNLDQVVHQNLSEIAKNAGVSVATVNRFCQSVGCEGFKDFRIVLAMNVSVSRQYLTPASTKPAKAAGLTQQVIGDMIEILKITQDLLDAADLNAATELLSKASRVAFFGVGGGSAILAQECANRFFRLGKVAEAHSDGFFQRMLSSTYGPNDVVVAISQSGRAADLIDSIKIAQQYGARSIAITRPDTPLARCCDVAVTLEVPESTDIFKPSASRVAFIAVIDILATGVAGRQPEQSRENLRRIRSSLATMEEDYQPRPIGD